MESNLRHILALNIRKRRYILGLSQAKLADAANIATTYVAMIELEKSSLLLKCWNGLPMR